MLLAMDTCGSLGSVALAKAGPAGLEVVTQADLLGKTYSALLIPTIWELLEAASIDLDELDALVVVNGPGSFTGVRVGVSAVKGLAEAASLPVIALSRLELLARQSEQRHVCAVLDAGRHEFYAGEYRSGERVREGLFDAGQLAALVSGDAMQVVICEPDLQASLADLHPELVKQPTAVDAARVGAERFAAKAFDDVLVLDGNYLRRSDAEIFARKPAEPVTK